MMASSGPQAEDRPGLIRGRLAGLPEPVWGPLAVGSMLGAVGLIGLAAGQPWLFPSLGPTALLIAEQPDQPSTRPWNTVVGHLIGLGAGLLAVVLLGASNAPAPMATGQLVPVRVGASVLAAVLAMPALALLRASHPPAAATMLLVALGGLPPTARTVASVAAGTLILATLGIGSRALRRPAP